MTQAPHAASDPRAMAAPLPDHPAEGPRWQPRQPRRPRAAPVQTLSTRGVGWVGVHGGAGATTLSIVLGGKDLGCGWPDPARAEPAQIMLVARTHAQGLRAASRAMDVLREGRHPPGMRLIGLVLIADAPGLLPLPLLTRIRLLRSIVPVWRVPWIAPWRVGKKVPGMPRQVERLGRVVQLCEENGRRPEALPR